MTYCGNGSVDLGEECDDGPLNGKNGHCSTICKLETCGNGVVDLGETCEHCPQDVQWCIIEQNCNICPCPYADFASDLISKDRIRVKLRDSSRKVFYRFSPEIQLSNIL
ncbi:MAG: hypothetical protein LBG52_00935 [Candidatus Peribacteria bacterium]|nr:hypothetical protein [Candidatus Peribacteria bacterium]